MDNMKRNKRNVLLAANISYILVILDSSIVNVALPTIKESLSLGVTTLRWGLFMTPINKLRLIFQAKLTLADPTPSKLIFN